MSSTLKPGNASRMVTIGPSFAPAQTRTRADAGRPLALSRARGRREGARRRRRCSSSTGELEAGGGLGTGHGRGIRKPVERMRELVLAEPGDRERREREERRHEPGDEERRREPDRLADRARDGHRDRHERERDEEVEARDATQHRRRHAPLQQRAPHHLGAVEQHADDEEGDHHDPQPRREADDRERHAADAPREDHEREVPARQPQRRDRERAHRAAQPERAEREGEGAGAAARLVLHGERQQHLDRPHDEEDEDDREHERREQPPRAQQVGEPVAQVDERLPERMRHHLVRDRGAPASCASSPSTIAATTCRHGDDREREPRRLHGDEQRSPAPGPRPASPRAAARPRCRSPRAAAPRAGWPAATPSTPGRRTRRPGPSTNESTAICHTSITPVAARTAATANARPRTISTAKRMRRCGMRSAATPPTSTASTSPRLDPTATYDRSIGEPPSSTTCHTAATSHAPADSSDAARAADEQPVLARRERAERARQPGRVGHRSIVACPADIRPRDQVSGRLRRATSRRGGRRRRGGWCPTGRAARCSPSG